MDRPVSQSVIQVDLRMPCLAIVRKDQVRGKGNSDIEEVLHINGFVQAGQQKHLMHIKGARKSFLIAGVKGGVCYHDAAGRDVGYPQGIQIKGIHILKSLIVEPENAVCLIKIVVAVKKAVVAKGVDLHIDIAQHQVRNPGDGHLLLMDKPERDCP